MKKLSITFLAPLMMLIVGVFLHLELSAQSSYFLETNRMTASDPDTIAWYGMSMSIQADQLLIGAPRDEVGTYRGAAYYYEKDPFGVWEEKQKLVSSDLVYWGFFGETVLLHNEYMIIGAPSDYLDETGADSLFQAGAVYFFERDSLGVWTQVQKLVSPFRAVNDFFGRGSYAYEHKVYIGSPGKDMGVGAVYVCSRDSVLGEWIIEQEIFPSDTAGSLAKSFGWNLVVSEGSMLVGASADQVGGFASGAVYAFEENGLGEWNEVQKIKASDVHAGANFGWSMEIMGNEAIIGAFGDRLGLPGGANINQAGAIYQFLRDTSTGIWNEEEKLVAPDRNHGAWFGRGISITDDFLLVGSGEDDFNEVGLDSLERAGSAYLYERNGTGGWDLLQKIVPQERMAIASFGLELEIYEDQLIIAALNTTVEDGGEFYASAGAVHFFELCEECNFLTGNIYTDYDADCVKDSSESNIKAQHVSATEGSNSYHALSDPDGNYMIRVPNGTYDVELFPYPYWDAPACGSLTYTQTFSGTAADTSSNDFPLTPLVLCPDMTVDIAAPALIRCFTGTYVVNYCNYGSIDADSAYIEIEFDPYLTPIFSSLPWELPVTGGIYRFNLGVVAWGDCGSFNVEVAVACDSTVLGQTHCTSAHIYPDSFCEAPSPLWDGASLQLEGECIGGDSVSFLISNTGTNMMVSGGLAVLEDAVFVLDTSIFLDAGEDTTLVYAGNGSTWTCQMEQSPNHPGNSQPLISIEGCGTDTTGAFSLGFVPMFPTDEGDDFIAIDCQQNVGSYDPNDKQGFPIGVGSAHQILESTGLDYMIRFQNTGTAMAYKVVIRDTLAPEFDITTVRTGAASHAYTFRIYGQRVLEWTFENILLPDSASNEPGSHGFINFRVEQLPGNPPGTLLENTAGIYFDYNHPILTNQTWHTLSQTIEVAIDETHSEIPPTDQLHLLVYPNPAEYQVNFELPDFQESSFQFDLYTLNGQRVHSRQHHHTNRFVFDRAELANGMYIFQIITRSGRRVSGRVVLK